VRDVAAAHIAVFESSNAAGKWFLIGTKFTYQEAIDVVRAKNPQPQSQLPVGGPGSGKQLGTYAHDTTVEKFLGRKLTPVEDTITSTFSQSLAREKSFVVSETAHTAREPRLAI
jgi:NADPH-dependent methylglyoxal reductase